MRNRQPRAADGKTGQILPDVAGTGKVLPGGAGNAGTLWTAGICLKHNLKWQAAGTAVPVAFLRCRGNSKIFIIFLRKYEDTK